ncbi:MAG: hypothetical protein ABJE66_08445 [Deltaproteobacteria bacterium]
MTRKDFLRKRVMPVVFGVVIALMARRSCNQSDRVHATIVLDFGSNAAQVQAVDADLWMNKEQVATYHRAALTDDIGPCKFDGLFPSTDGELRVDVTLRSGKHENVKRAVHADDNATVTVNLTDLR